MIHNCAIFSIFRNLNIIITFLKYFYLIKVSFFGVCWPKMQLLEAASRWGHPQKLSIYNKLRLCREQLRFQIKRLLPKNPTERMTDVFLSMLLNTKRKMKNITRSGIIEVG